MLEETHVEPTLNVAALHDLACYGRCSLTCVIPILSAMGIKVCPVPTAVYSSDTGGFGPVYAQELTEAMRRILDKLCAIPARIDGIYSGYLGTPEQLTVVSDYFDRFDCLKVVDPVMGDQGALYSAFDARMVDTMRALCKKASVITPNLTEASFLLGRETPASLTRAQAVELLSALHELTPGDAVITSAALADFPDSVCTLARDDQGAFAVIAPRLPGHFPGTGDVFTSVLTGALLSGQGLPQAVCRAAAFVSRCMADTVRAGTPVREGVLLERALPRLADAPRGIETVALE